METPPGPEDLSRAGGDSRRALGYPIDIWTVGCLIWDMFEGRQLFYGTDPEHGAYRLRARLAEIIAVLGPPPPDSSRAQNTGKFLTKDGTYAAGIPLPDPTPLDTLETSLGDEDGKKLFMVFVRKMLRWMPEER
ncbi:Protein kinase domain protein [Mycena sanguinolenta]|uniref:Protein kinase domain protein n=1 Tax=Mycena sanguinolenta TaxID=230812 RepID=A0A8H6YXA0_9AGAR|nr:Protein kinase domain protein [Mycena sanguinolenta]